MREQYNFKRRFQLFSIPILKFHLCRFILDDQRNVILWKCESWPWNFSALSPEMAPHFTLKKSKVLTMILYDLEPATSLTSALSLSLSLTLCQCLWPLGYSSNGVPSYIRANTYFFCLESPSKCQHNWFPLQEFSRRH